MSSLLTQRFISQYGNLANRYDYVSPTGTMNKKILFYLAIIGIVAGLSLIVISSIKKKSKPTEHNSQSDEYADEYADEYGVQSVDEYDDELGEKPVKKTKKRSLLQKILLVIGILVLLSSFTGVGYYGFIYFTKYLPQYKEWYSRLPNNAVQDLSILKSVSTLEKNINNLRK